MYILYKPNHLSWKKQKNLQFRQCLTFHFIISYARNIHLLKLHDLCIRATTNNLKKGTDKSESTRSSEFTTMAAAFLSVIWQLQYSVRVTIFRQVKNPCFRLPKLESNLVSTVALRCKSTVRTALTPRQVENLKICHFYQFMYKLLSAD